MANGSANALTQHGQILDYLGRTEWITPMDAFVNLGITKLATRVSEMKKTGRKFRSEFVEVDNRYGKTVRVKRYALDKSEE